MAAVAARARGIKLHHQDPDAPAVTLKGRRRLRARLLWHIWLAGRRQGLDHASYGFRIGNHLLSWTS
jgi:hypothetical protein